ncbi:MAG TPA: hypothetical protein VIN06_05145 [Devosia sp.]
MNALTELGNAAIGWLDLVGNRPNAREKFNLSRAGLVTMLGWYFVIVILVRLIQQAVLFGTLPGAEALLVTIAYNGLPLLVLWLVAFGTVRFLKPGLGILPLLVPAGYALTFIVIVGLPVSLLSDAASAVLQGILGYMLFRLAREFGGFSFGVAIGYAVLSILLLVAVPVGLYMLLVPEIPTPD